MCYLRMHASGVQPCADYMHLLMHSRNACIQDWAYGLDATRSRTQVGLLFVALTRVQLQPSKWWVPAWACTTYGSDPGEGSIGAVQEPTLDTISRMQDVELRRLHLLLINSQAYCIIRVRPRLNYFGVVSFTEPLELPRDSY